MIKKASNKALYESLQAKGIEPLNMSEGNKKLQNTAFVRFLIWNLPAIITCPFATELCKKFCYARKAEKAYPDCLPSRQRNFETSKQADFIIRAIFTILWTLHRDGKKNRTVVVRIHEIGDFYNQSYTSAWLEVAKALSGEKVTFIAYTKSFRYFDGKELPKNFHLRASIWSDTKPEDIETINRNGWNIYTAVESFKTGDTFTRCRCTDCATCKKCWQNYKDIRCEIH